MASSDKVAAVALKATGSGVGRLEVESVDNSLVAFGVWALPRVLL